MFTKETGLALAEALNKDSAFSPGRFDEAKDAFIFMEDEGRDEPYEVNGIDVVLDGEKRHVYEIGANSWVLV